METEKNDIIDCVIEDIGIYGEGISHVGGQTVFIPGALKGERVCARVVLAKPTFAHAVLVRRLTTSPERREPPCPYFKQCGGCSLQHLSYDGQLELKRGIVRGALKKYAGIDFEVGPTVPSQNEYGYRNKISLPVRQTKDGAKMGLFAARSHRLVGIENCMLQKTPTFEAAAKAFEFAVGSGLKGYDEQSGAGDLRHITVRSISGELSVTYVLNGERKEFEKRLEDEAKRQGRADFSLFVNYNTRRDNVILGEKSRLICGKATALTSGLEVETHPQAFFQVNDNIREKLYNAVCDEVEAGGSVVDAYCGAGIMSALVARSAAHVLGIEISSAAVESAQRLKQRHEIANLDFVCGDCAALTDKAIKAAGSGPTLILDPPKTGCAPQVLNAALPAKKIIYVSCNPATLARDAAFLVENGFALAKVRPYDMFPQTTSIETLAVLDRS